MHAWNIATKLMDARSLSELAVFAEQLDECMRCFNSEHWFISPVIILTVGSLTHVSIQVSASLLGNLQQYTITRQLYQDFLQQEVSAWDEHKTGRHTGPEVHMPSLKLSVLTVQKEISRVGPGPENEARLEQKLKFTPVRRNTIRCDCVIFLSRPSAELYFLCWC